MGQELIALSNLTIDKSCKHVYAILHIIVKESGSCGRLYFLCF
jgi:hypothetical protein